mmetsp:Transcript_2361/g.7821  ORF Transcript_2361/g.7821 Transcript_2361/m.7821 type:complete len:200 (-) Transcript_2361:321-920(-)
MQAQTSPWACSSSSPGSPPGSPQRARTWYTRRLAPGPSAASQPTRRPPHPGAACATSAAPATRACSVSVPSPVPLRSGGRTPATRAPTWSCPPVPWRRVPCSWWRATCSSLWSAPPPSRASCGACSSSQGCSRRCTTQSRARGLPRPPTRGMRGTTRQRSPPNIGPGTLARWTCCAHARGLGLHGISSVPATARARALF